MYIIREDYNLDNLLDLGFSIIDEGSKKFYRNDICKESLEICVDINTREVDLGADTYLAFEIADTLYYLISEKIIVKK